MILVRDPDDAVVVEAAIDGRADYLVTHNLRHFVEVVDVLSVVTPGELLGRSCGRWSDEREAGISPEDVRVAQAGGGAAGVRGRRLAELLDQHRRGAEDRCLETTEHFRRRYGEPRPGDLRAVLDKRPDVPPEPGDGSPQTSSLASAGPQRGRALGYRNGSRMLT